MILLPLLGLVLAVLPIALFVLTIMLLKRCIKRRTEYKNNMPADTRRDSKLTKLTLRTAAAALLIPLTLWFFPITTYYTFDPDHVLKTSGNVPDDGKFYLTSGSQIMDYGCKLNNIPFFIAPIAICNRLDDYRVIVRYVRGFSFLAPSHAYTAIIINSNELGSDYSFVDPDLYF